MKDLDAELWKYGIPSKTKHNEVAPAQHEVACVYAKVNITTDNNHLLMQIAQDIAKKHGLRCLLHEKPFAGVNGSGKHDNWSVITNTGINLFNPGKNPEENNKPDVPQKVTVGDRFRHKITGNISEVVSLTGAFPWIADECTVTRDSGAFSVTENISYNQLLNSDLYEYIDHTDRTVEQAKTSMKSDMKIENFKITGDFIIEGGAKSKFKANSEAIRTLKMIEKENRPATPEEQVILSRYVGWGGLSAGF